MYLKLFLSLFLIPSLFGMHHKKRWNPLPPLRSSYKKSKTEKFEISGYLKFLPTELRSLLYLKLLSDCKNRDLISDYIKQIDPADAADASYLIFMNSSIYSPSTKEILLGKLESRISHLKDSCKTEKGKDLQTTIANNYEIAIFFRQAARKQESFIEDANIDDEIILPYLLNEEQKSNNKKNSVIAFLQKHITRKQITDFKEWKELRPTPYLL